MYVLSISNFFFSVKDAGTEALFPEVFTFLVSVEDFKANIQVRTTNYVRACIYVCMLFRLRTFLKY